MLSFVGVQSCMHVMHSSTHALSIMHNAPCIFILTSDQIKSVGVSLVLLVWWCCLAVLSCGLSLVVVFVW